MKAIESEIEFRNRFIDEAKQIIDQYPSAVQVVLFETISGQTEPFIIFDLDDENAEKEFFDKLKEKGMSQIRQAIAMWGNHPDLILLSTPAIEVPKYTILLKLLELDKRNIDTCILCNGEKGVTGFALKRIIPVEKYLNE